MTSDAGYDEVYVWIWLPGTIEPVVAGRLAREDEQLVFHYGRSYLERDDAVALHPGELPLRSGLIRPLSGLSMPGCIRDAAPDAWGRRVILNRRFGVKGKDADTGQLDELTCLLESGSDRPGALDFQASPEAYVPRQPGAASLEELQEAAERVEAGVPLSPELELALFHGSSLGGARPKAMVETAGRKYIAKFASSSDLYNVVKAEYLAMRLAALAGLDVARVRLESAAGKDVLLVERFDREPATEGWYRHAMVSALTLLELDEMMARYASYRDLADVIRYHFHDPRKTLHELFARLVFNVLSGNTDDHARNHAAFVDGERYRLTPAFDLCPQSRSGNEASQAMLIDEDSRMSRLSTCLDAAPHFLLDEARARALIEDQITIVEQQWSRVCDEAALSEVDRNYMYRRQFLNPFIFEGFADS